MSHFYAYFRINCKPLKNLNNDVFRGNFLTCDFYSQKNITRNNNKNENSKPSFSRADYSSGKKSNIQLRLKNSISIR